MGPASPNRRHWRHSGHRLSHHRGVPIDPFSAFEPYGGAVPPSSWPDTCWWPRPAWPTPTSRAGWCWSSTTATPAPSGWSSTGPAGCAVGELLPQWQEWATAPGRAVHRWPGGPQRPDRPGPPGLPRGGRRRVGPCAPSGWRLLVDGDRPVGTVDLAADPPAVAGGLRRGPAVLGLRRLGLGPARGGDRRGVVVRGAGRGRRSRSPPIRRACGGGSSGARAVRWPWCRGSPRTRP